MKPSRTLTDEDIAVAKALIASGWAQSDVASFLGCNSGRVAEINTGARGADIPTADITAAPVLAHIARLHVEWTLRIGEQLREVVT